MKTIICIMMFAVFIPAISNAEDTGLFLRAVVKEGSAKSLTLTDEDGRKVLVSSTAITTPDDVESATTDGEDKVFIRFQFKSSAHSKLKKATKSMIGKNLAVIIDGKLISAPVVRDSFSSGVSVTGDFSREWAERVVERANANPKG